ncbi:MAG: AraC family transcriptional regulator [Eubacteriales bacterium]|nr:AraC family transcriptional regulator [Eubacteriales bacterium]
MYEKKPEPSPYHHKPPMHFKDYEIHYNRDYTLTQIVPNKHNYYEFYFLISGDVTYFIDNRKYHLQPGDIILISPNQKHHAQISAETNKPYERYVLWLNPIFLDNLSSKKSNLSSIFQNTSISSSLIRLPATAYNILHSLLEKIFINTNSQKYGADLLSNSAIIELLVNLAQFRLFYTNVDTDTDIIQNVSVGNKNANSLIFNILRYINTNIYNTITINDICSYFYISRSSVSAKFQEELGMSIHQYIIKKKLFLAKQDLADGMNIQDVVEKYNFGNYTSFYRAFKSEYGHSPQKSKLIIQNSKKK